MEQNNQQNGKQSQDEELKLLLFQIDALNRLLEVQEKTAIEQTKLLYEEILERKKAEEMLQIAQNQIVMSRKLAAIGQLSAGVSHEVLNPLNIISLHTQMQLRKIKDNPELIKYLNVIMNEAKRIEKIVSSLLKVSRENRDKEPSPVQIQAELESVLALVEKEYAVDNIEIRRDFQPDLPLVKADKDEIRQVFLNLIQNAKYAMRDQGTLTVSAEKINKEESGHVRIKISDTGEGMSKEHLEKIFEPFFTTKPEGKGTGLGLYIVHGIIERHRGTIAAESEPGQGTTFTIDLPAV
ncbi:MAG: hypothetical protein HZA02_04625 [Nitrospinae bacterium]|nr:hypothetical protein [Nitrospinota bacterium]